MKAATRHRFAFALSLAFVLSSLVSCAGNPNERTVVVYTSVDQVFSEPVLQRFEQQTGIRVLAVYDVEAAKTTGLVARLVAEKDRPRADVFWNGEFAQTMALDHAGVLAAYQPTTAADLPRRFVDADGYWTAVGCRARVLLVNTRLVAPGDRPSSIFDLSDPKRPRGSTGMALPLFGTTATHAAALFASLGPERALEFFSTLETRGVRVVDGNSVVRDLVVRGDLAVGLTDTDDACGALERGDPVEAILPDQDSFGTLLVPGTVALVAGSPHPAEARALVDYLAGIDVERQLLESGCSQIALRPGLENSPWLPVDGVRGMDVSLEDIFRQMAPSRTELRRLFVK